jgi:Asp-tRNA(Asn)/Glu-tRNA(Gln) amidotransferase A subunit family amidase
MLAELAAAVRERRVSAEELARTSLGRMERLNPALNAVILVREEALEEARALDAHIASGLDPAEDLPLLGLPMLVKDNEDCAGLPTTFGSLFRAGSDPAVADCEAVARLRAAGAIVVGKTNVPEFAFEGFTSNRLFGATGNPWAPEWSPGGSSGGSGAALAAGMAPLATGTDGGGSVRIPAAFCGLVGLKPTNGLIGLWPPPSWIDLSTKGPLATSIADARLLLEVLRGPIAGAPTAVPAWESRPHARASRIFATPRLVAHDEPISSAILALFDAALVKLEAATGVPVEPIDPPYPSGLDDDWFLLVAADELTWLGRDLVAERRDDLTEYLRVALDIGSRVTIDEYQDARRRRFTYCRQTDELLGEDAVLVCPTMCVEGFTAEGQMPGAEWHGVTDGFHYNTQPANSTGHPALSVPAGVSPNGVPFGIHVTGPRFRDDLVLNVGAAWEAAAPWPLTAPGYEPFAVGA